jgi:hypothetical protein
VRVNGKAASARAYELLVRYQPLYFIHISVRNKAGDAWTSICICYTQSLYTRDVAPLRPLVDCLHIRSPIHGQKVQVLPSVQEGVVANTVANRPQKRADTIPYLSVAKHDGSCSTTLYSLRPTCGSGAGTSPVCRVGRFFGS